MKISYRDLQLRMRNVPPHLRHTTGSSDAMLRGFCKVDASGCIRHIIAVSQICACQRVAWIDLRSQFETLQLCFPCILQDGSTPLHFAAENGHADSVQLLIRQEL